MEKPRVVVVMGVAGSGKSTVGALLAVRNGGQFYDADEFHPPSNIAKMAAGTPLDDEDRIPWLQRLREEVIDATPINEFSVLACSALKKIYRDRLGIGTNGIALVFLKGSPAMLAERLQNRTGHYMKAAMLASQLATLEAPSIHEGITVGIEPPVIEIVARIEELLGLGK